MFTPEVSILSLLSPTQVHFPPRDSIKAMSFSTKPTLGTFCKVTSSEAYKEAKINFEAEIAEPEGVTEPLREAFPSTFIECIK